MAALAVFLPLLSALIVGFGGRYGLTDKRCQWISCSFLVLSTVCAAITFYEVAIGQSFSTEILLEWIHVGSFKVEWGLKLDTLSTSMLAMVTLVSTMVHIYSVGYMSHDPSIPRFMSYISLFTFFMLMLVTAPNLLQLFFGWEGVGLTSYLLIGFWFHKDSANAAAIKAFLVNRVGDIGFALGVIAVFVIFNTLTFDEIFAKLPSVVGSTHEFLGIEISSITLIALLLFIGAMGKSAQFGLHTWLPDAMEGPTPVSALIHAATMVTAGVFMLVRMSPLLEFSTTALSVIAVVGAITALFSATIAITQFDIKRVIAYSTCSQLGYMVFSVGASAYSVAMFHLITHAFFKALLFLGSGAVIHAMSDEQDMRNMGGLYKLIPGVYAVMWIGSLALSGMPFFAGYFSKDAILEAAWGSNLSVSSFAYVMGVVVAFLTALYSGRLLFLTFHGKPRASEEVMSHVHEPPLNMSIPLYILSFGAIFSGYLGKGFFLSDVAYYWKDAVAYSAQVVSLEHAHHSPFYILYLPTLAGVVGLVLSYYFYFVNPSLPQKVADSFKALYTFFYNKWFVDELYHFLFISPSLLIGKLLWHGADEKIINKYGPDGVASLSLYFSGLVRRMQSGYVYHYAFVMLLGVLFLITSVFVQFNVGGFFK